VNGPGRFRGKVAIVTGGSHRLGREIPSRAVTFVPGAAGAGAFWSPVASDFRRRGTSTSSIFRDSAPFRSRLPLLNFRQRPARDELISRQP
jgi:hypothetical protein